MYPQSTFFYKQDFAIGHYLTFYGIVDMGLDSPSLRISPIRQLLGESVWRKEASPFFFELIAHYNSY
jgi:hypothetical protein